jgi:uncharacterized protein
MDSEVTVVRLYLSETDHGRHKALVSDILKLLHDQHRVKGVTVFRGIAGFGEGGEVRAADILTSLVDLPLVIEFFDAPSAVEAVLPLLKNLVPQNHVVSWKANSR